MHSYITVGISPNAKPAKVGARSAIKIGGLPFSTYIGKRLLKDGLGFIPLVDEHNHAYTQRGSHIVARVPENEVDFLVYCHELGHNKTPQPESNMGFFSSADKNCLIREFNAWRWGIKYFKRLGFTLTDACKDSIKSSFESYTNGVDKSLAKKFEEDLSALAGVQICGREPGNLFSINTIQITLGGKTWGEHFTVDRPIAKPVATKPKNWKPWHELKDKQIKRDWRNQR